MIKRIPLFLALALASAAAPAQTVNCVAAVVNGQIITRLDVEIAVYFGLAGGPGAEPGADPRRAALDALIDRKIVLDLSHEARGVSGEELDAALAELRRDVGEAAFAAGLRKFGLTAADLEPYLEERLLFRRALDVRFSQSLPVSMTEIERYYRDIYAPEQAQRGVAAEPLDRVDGAIETRIRGERLAQQTSAFLRDLRNRADIQIRKDCLQ
ncbi:MAG TPA: hypothetical protein P5119_06700 [Candidatus Aminicenantes bacterium]|nr:hypothetical protein [Candidatus Aminicenantes bacterium]HRY65017.1 hypothetical protein [Candidatus Aminicenantes bacterium]HRZ71930.1 hypothetical protein [Candidatus Aminicenantes bacterium]